MTEQASTLPEGSGTIAPAEGTPVVPASSTPEVDGWRSGLSPELQGNASLANFKDVEGLAKSFLETKSMQGNSIHLLGEDASDEQRTAQAQEIMAKIPGYMPKPDFDNAEQSDSFYQSLGKPAEAKDYTNIEGVNEVLPGWTDVAFKANLTDSQQKAAVDYLAGLSENNNKAGLEAYNNSVAALKEELGGAYETTYRQAERMAGIMSEKTGVTGDMESFKTGNVSPQAIKMYAAMYEMAGGSENSSITHDDGGTRPDTPAEAQAKISQINANKEHPYWTEIGGTEERARLDKMMVRLQNEAKGRLASVG